MAEALKAERAGNRGPKQARCFVYPNLVITRKHNLGSACSSLQRGGRHCNQQMTCTTWNGFNDLHGTCKFQYIYYSSIYFFFDYARQDKLHQQLTQHTTR